LGQQSEGAHGAPRSEHGERQGSSKVPVFVPVRVVPAAALEVVLGDGRVVRVPAGFDAATLRQLFAVLAETPPC
jgi:hypothetical protein